ncbi:C40 family peptidase, partial [Streptomyces sp. UNOC14_S4]|uniref:C40 family peptidase n=1 Tax=Streptomyces sp. UNOC14_S4 TaxID=2872340 RepID=UPI001E54AF1C
GEAAAGRRDLEPAIAFAMARIGDAYALGGNGPHKWDCSGLIQQAYRRAGVKLPRVAADQYRATMRIKRSSLRRGDIVFWSGDGRASGVHHAGIYLGGGRYIEAPRPGKKVRVSTFARYNPNLYGRVR